MIPGGQFRHHATITGMDFDLTVDGMGEHTAAAGIDGDAGFVAGGFDAQDAHGAKIPLVRGSAGPPW